MSTHKNSGNLSKNTRLFDFGWIIFEIKEGNSTSTISET